MSLPQESPLWMRLLVLSESMDDPECAAEHVIAFLRGLEEGFAHAIDPAEQFPEFATIRLCRSMVSLLGRLQQQPSP